MPFELVVLRGRSSQSTIKLGSGVTTVGRLEECQLRLVSSQVSRRHCELFEKSGHLLVKDVGSSNGTFVNGERIEGQRVLEPGNELRIGQFRFRVQKVEEAAAAKTPTPSAADTAVRPAEPEAIALAEDDAFEISLDDTTASDSVATTTATSGAAAASGSPAPPEPKAKKSELGEEAVADFLLSIELDDEDKP